jgi:hypothetical protein
LEGGTSSPSPRQPTPTEDTKLTAGIIIIYLIHNRIVKPTASLQIFEEKELLLNSIELDKNVNLFLEETPTIWLLDMPGMLSISTSDLTLYFRFDR